MTHPDISGSDLAGAIVASYVNLDQIMIDDQARSHFLEEAYNFTREASAETVVKDINLDITLTSVNLEAMPSLLVAIDNLVNLLSSIDQGKIIKARIYTQSIIGVFGNDDPQSYVDLGNFSQLLRIESNDPRVIQASDQLLSLIRQSIIA